MGSIPAEGTDKLKQWIFVSLEKANCFAFVRNRKDFRYPVIKTPEELTKVVSEAGLEKLIACFDGGLEAKVATTGDSLSLGQKQLIAFMRAVLRQPKLIILDEATSNIDAVTEGLLQEILNKLPATTTGVIITHRLNTIEHADVIYFLNAGTLTKAGSMQEAIILLQEGTQTS